MDHGMDGHGMGGMMMTPPPSSSSSSSMNMGGASSHKKMMMHMTFYWGKDALVLFNGWPGTHISMYILSLIFVFVLAFLVEWLSRSRIVKSRRNDVVSGLMLTLLHALRMGLAYLVMLAVMSFNGGIFLVAVAGHAIGFFIFGSRVFESGRKGSEDPDLPPMSC
ncbi:hypothetical protein BVRB_7g173030 [Beta vulgaris subsp. vulgaris]|uniref:copper transporter 1 n=1 Tax=Beta vulgaris subsp. vulgaris TaxID=3555 RepID=UPI00053FDEC3|nr:copper transporter 1 [Beta vulgaris subsp. vulgaris]KMT05155.1 hypothetical protein BVRB_7g173030 [Beta vulgaris subsp. vulgaris]